MKGFQIGDIAHYYKLSPDSLRHYEKLGLIKPDRQVNNYREYDYVDLWKLNIIKELRLLDFPFRKILAYFNSRTVASTMRLLLEETAKIDEQIRKLKKMRATIESKIEVIRRFEDLGVNAEVTRKNFGPRACIDFAEPIQATEQIDFYFRRLQMKAGERIPLIGNKVLCIFMPPERLRADGNFYSRVFTMLPKSAGSCDFVLPGGDYLSVTYRGPHHLSRDNALRLIAHALANGLEPAGEPFEICHIDIHETSDRSEYITEIQMAIRDGGDSGAEAPHGS